MLTSTTAPGKEFSSRSELADHYKSDWHKYNLKRREAGLPLLEEPDFQARWEAALALRKEKEAKAHSGTDHLKHQRASSKKHQQPSAKKTLDQKATDGEVEEDTPKESAGKQLPQKLVESQENPNIDPTESLFDNHMSQSLEENVDYMRLKFGFFIPDRGTLHVERR
jgi:pre-60S factor REI1